MFSLHLAGSYSVLTDQWLQANDLGFLMICYFAVMRRKYKSGERLINKGHYLSQYCFEILAWAKSFPRKRSLVNAVRQGHFKEERQGTFSLKQNEKKNVTMDDHCGIYSDLFASIAIIRLSDSKTKLFPTSSHCFALR